MDVVPLPEIPDFRQRTVVIATVNGHEVVFSESHRSVYTEQNLKIEKVLTTNRPAVTPSSVVTMLERGGAVQLPTGVLQYEVDPRAQVIEPERRYLLFLQYFSVGDFFRLVKAWEILEGKAMPCWREDVDRAIKGNSRYAGMDESNFIWAVEQMVRIQDEKRGGR